MARKQTPGIAAMTGAMTGALVPGAFVRHPGQPEWGYGQIQSVIGDRITVNFEHAGKRLINGVIIDLDIMDGPPVPGSSQQD